MGTRAVLTKTIPDPAPDILKDAVEELDWNKEDRDLSREELLEKVKFARGVLCLLTDTIDRTVLEAAASGGCKIFSNYAVGYNNIDVEAATRLGIMVTNTPGVLTDTTADLTWALIMACARRIPEADSYTRAGKFKGWSPTLLLGGDVFEKTLGIVGAGRIGTEVALRGKGFRMKILYVDTMIHEKMERKLDARRVTLSELLCQSDFVSLHVPLTEETWHMIGEEQLRMMKSDAYLINTCRGPVVDETALVRILKDRVIAGAGLDVYEREPALAPGLMECANAVLLPHVGSGSRETRSKMARMAAENCVAGMKGLRPPHIVNEEVLS